MSTVFLATCDHVLPTLTRLHLLCLLDTHEWRRPLFLCRSTGSTQDQLKRHLNALRGGGYITTRRGRERVGLVRLTPLGARQREAYLATLAALPSWATEQITRARGDRPDWFVTTGAMNP
ncbi:transcriptional regulator [Amycolatopsis sp. NPDC059021]|uniref:transcriptional regulator n=1 Tax=Amycolatopsis sp. NPDC059021 TaxID=3346704 RepID=UPI003671A298